jgi:LAO/AO transport system ATPase
MSRDDGVGGLVAGVLDGDHHALARAITKIEERGPGYRDLVSGLHAHAGDAAVVGVTGSPGAGKSTLVDKVAETYRDRGLTVGVIAVDPASPYTGGAVLGDRIRMGSNVGDMDVFFRSMSARGQLGGLAAATSDAITALDAFGKDRVVVETVGAGQNEVDVVRTADTVVVLVQPGSGDDVQMLKAGILEIGDVFVVNKADMDGAAQTVADLREMLHLGEGSPATRARAMRTQTTRSGAPRSSRPSPPTGRASTTCSTRWPPTATTWRRRANSTNAPGSVTRRRFDATSGTTSPPCWRRNSTNGAGWRRSSTGWWHARRTLTPSSTRWSNRSRSACAGGTDAPAYKSAQPPRPGMNLRRVGYAVAGLAAGAVAVDRLLGDAAGELEPALDAPERTYRWRGLDVAYAEAGDPADPDVVCLHGLNAAGSSGEFRNVFADLAESYHVVAPDLPGFGRSDRPPLRYSAALYEDFVADFLGEFDAPGVVASSLASAYVARAVAEGAAVSSLVGVCPTTRGGPDPPKAWLRELLRAPVVGDALFDLLTSRPSIRYFNADHAYGNAGAITDEWTDYQWRTTHQPNARFAVAGFVSGHCNSTLDLGATLGSVDAPVTLVWGREATLPPLSVGREMAETADARLVVVDHAKLLPHVEYPAEFVDVATEALG